MPRLPFASFAVAMFTSFVIKPGEDVGVRLEGSWLDGALSLRVFILSGHGSVCARVSL